MKRTGPSSVPKTKTVTLPHENLLLKSQQHFLAKYLRKYPPVKKPGIATNESTLAEYR